MYDYAAIPFLARRVLLPVLFMIEMAPVIKPSLMHSDAVIITAA